MKSLTGLDATFLYLETPEMPAWLGPEPERLVGHS